MESFQVKELDGQRMLEFGNCVFMPKWEAPNMKWFAELGEVDLDGAINSMNAEHRTGAENVVDFGERRVVKMGKEGNVAFSLVAIPKAGSASIAHSESDNAVGGKTHTDRRKAKGSIHVQLKKRSAFDDEAEKEVEEARKKKRWWLTR
ncbi:hypothetical protein GYMLUDRAFT_60321 [Collybiopsis luxurians FD-317 M1]|uniref:Uncharacterized protein n=1 Tax=Collybiopsis luxurians FD-317 M1 TaxID=944289 RepID=A0A0D0B6N9_9AGAR|nr:hypothetical protein GYMLUDRAFT_60321 [Collybiopsis luxurians FD-317 M1]